MTCRRSAFSLIEVLVVLAIIALLVGLLLPAVQALREASRRTSCVNNLMQLGIAFQNYQVTHDVLPPGTIDHKGPVIAGPPGYQYSWVVQLLPYIEQKNLFKKFDDHHSVYDPAQSTARSTVLNFLLCPSDQAFNGSGSVSSRFAAVQSSYYGVHHDVEAPIDTTNHGLLFLNSAIRYDDIVDGSSNTILVAEARVEADGFGWASGTRATLRNGGWDLSRRYVAFVNKGVLTRSNLPGPKSRPLTEDFSAAKTPENPKPAGGFSSYHPGGINALMADGHVSFLRSTTTVLQNLTNRHDGETISADQ